MHTSVHPFPARMAPEIAFEVINNLTKRSIVVDPMVGSGTTLRIAAEQGYKTFGNDVEPLALLISEAWNINLSSTKILQAAERLIEQAKQQKYVSLEWLDVETKAFIRFWFADKQRLQLTKISYLINHEQEIQLKVVFQIALSRCIITKDKGASLARDVSHAKPHKVSDNNDFDVFEGFLQAIKTVTKRLNTKKNKHEIILNRGDARDLEFEDGIADCLITSPPYLHAVDYFRGHRLSLVWMGFTLEQLRNMRSKSIGLEKNPDVNIDKDFMNLLLRDVCLINQLPSKNQRHLQRYALDVYMMTSEWFRILKRNKKATAVIADSFCSGVSIKSTQLIKNAARIQGFYLVSDIKRQIPTNKRYLPPPEYITNSALQNRMKTESILTFLKP